MRAAALLALALAAPALAAPSDAPTVHVRVEGFHAQVWSGEVTLPASYTFVAEGGAAHTQDGRTPLGALWAASQQAGFGLDIRDEYDDLEPIRIAGEAWWEAKWWDYRVNDVQTNYGPQQQWLAAGPSLANGDEVLWYVEQPGMTPLRLSLLAQAGRGPCAVAARVEQPVLDPLVQAGQPWPTLTWGPAPLARLGGAGGDAPAVAGAGWGVVTEPGPLWAEEQPLPVGLLIHYVRSERAAVACPAR
jgi:hypothetical protein